MKHHRSSLSLFVPVILLTDLVFLVVIYLVRPAALMKVAPFCLLFSLLTIFLTAILHHRHTDRQIEVISSLLRDPTVDHLKEAKDELPTIWHPLIDNAWARTQDRTSETERMRVALLDHQEYIESWTHEIKTPLSLAHLLIGNHSDEMSPYVLKCLRHIDHSIAFQIDQIMYYARLQADHKDEYFEPLELAPFLAAIADEFRLAADEQDVAITTRSTHTVVMTDKRVLRFIMLQLISNAIKYSSDAKDGGQVWITARKEASSLSPDQQDHVVIQVRDNGCGISPSDLPFIFDKGFTGMQDRRQKASGMGLYFAKQYADRCGIRLSVPPQTSLGFKIELIFPMTTDLPQKKDQG